VAGTSTFPTRGALQRKLGFSPVDAMVGLALFLLVFAFLRVGRGATVALVPSKLSRLDTSPVNLPYYAARSLIRMFVALFFSVTFSLVYAYAAAHSRRLRRILVPALDILQSVPVLGYLSVTITLFLTLFPHSVLGLEAASVFAVFTAQAWNMTFSFYQSLITLPRDMDEAGRVLGLSRWKRFWNIELPSGAIGLVWNGMMSFGGSWFFLTASEQISVPGHGGYVLPGIGSYVGVASARGQTGRVVLAIVVMIAIVVLVNVLFWRPLTAYVERFRVEESEATEKQRSLVLGILRRSALPRLIVRGAHVGLAPVNRLMSRVTGADDRSLVQPAQSRRRAGDIAFYSLTLGALAFGLYRVLTYVGSGHGGLGIFAQTFGLGFLTFSRVIVLLIVATIIWVPVGVWIGFNPRVTRIAQPVVQVLASFPANFLFPFAIIVFADLGVSLNFGGIVLMALGAQWYILFNVIAGASAVPNDLREAMRNLGVRGRTQWRRLILPGIFPAYVTGAITAAGGAWNASIVAEIVPYHGKTLVASGLGAYISQSTAAFDFHKILAGLLTMCVYVVGTNTLLWRRLYRLAETRYTLA
jgi:NitT/TauT family transport system permease protein